jgi:diguanylate cyclase (GGDEF)-like protein
MAVRRSILRVLVIDRSVEDMRLVRDLLQGEPDIRVQAARDLDEAIDLLEREPLDAVLLDQELWDDAGTGIVRFLRERRPDIAVVLLTSGDNDRDVLPAMKLGAHDFISKKGIDRSQLVTRLLGAVEESRTMRRRDTMVRWLEREARTDHLTGLYNRRAFDDELRNICAQAKETGDPVALIFIDITGTRVVNEAHGHEAGDGMIRRAAAGIARCLRGGDFAARVGGDDFGVIVRGGTMDLGKRIARRIAHEVERMNAEEWAHEIPVSLTFGLASGVSPEPGVLFSAAEHKVAGRTLSRNLPSQLVYDDENDGPSVA